MSLSRLTGDDAGDVVDQLLAYNEAERVRALLDRSHSYMRHSGLLPPREEFETVDWYITVLKMLEKALRSVERFYQFLPTPAQRSLNLDHLMEWDAAQRESRRKRGGGKLLDAWLDRAFHQVIADVRATQPGNRNGRLFWGARRLAELGFDEHDSKRELEHAAQYNNVWKDDGPGQCRATIESGWNKGIAEPADLAEIEARLGNAVK